MSGIFPVPAINPPIRTFDCDCTTARHDTFFAELPAPPCLLANSTTAGHGKLDQRACFSCTEGEYKHLICLVRSGNTDKFPREKRENARRYSSNAQTQFGPHGTFLPICINAWTMSTRSLLDRSISSSWNHAQAFAVLQPSYVCIAWFAHPPGRPQPSLEGALHSDMSNQACLLADRCALPALSGAAKRHAKLNET